MTKLEKKLRASLRQLGVPKSERILVAASGGADSTALLDALTRWKKAENLFAAHLNHQLRGAESDTDETFVRELAARLKLPVLIASENIAARAQNEKANLEAIARKARYDFLPQAARQCQADIIVTAHTRDDQVETLLMRLLRGTGAAGLSGIQATVELAADLRLVRPMLEITRAEVLAHCRHYDLFYCHDSSNDSMEFTRNRIRRELIPLLQTFNPDFGQALIRVAAQINEDDVYLQSEAQKLTAELAAGKTLSFKPLLALPPALRRRVLRQWIRQTRGDLRRLGADHLLMLDDLMMRGEGGQYVELPYGWQVHRRGHQLSLQAIDSE